MVNSEFAVGPECLADCSNNVMFMMCGPVFCGKNVIRYSVVCLPVRLYELFVVLEALVFGVGYGGEVGGAVSSVLGMCLLKSVTGVFPRSTPMIDQRPPLDFCSSWCRRKKVLLCRFVLSIVVCLQPPRMWVLLSGDWNFVHVGLGPFFCCICVRVLPMLPPSRLCAPGRGLWSMHV